MLEIAIEVKGIYRLEGTVHVIDIDPCQVARQLRWREQFELSEQIVLRLIPSIVTGSIYQQSERPVP